MNATDDICYEVEPGRLSAGAWSHELDRQIGEGDIHASYSADRIGMDQPLRAPFSYKGHRWVCVGFGTGPVAWAYRLVPAATFAGTPTTYAHKVEREGGYDAHSDPMGFYHGMTVRSARQELVLCGPPARFVPGQISQLSLF